MITTRNVAIVIFDAVEVLDFAGPFEVFTVASAVLKAQTMPPFFPYTVGLTEQPIAARGGLRVIPHFSLETCPQPDWLIVPGGRGVLNLLRNPRFTAWLQSQFPQVEKMMSVCTGALTLAQAGFLQGLHATTHHTAFDDLVGLAPDVTVLADQRFVAGLGGKVITAGGVSAGIDMALALVEAWLGAEGAALTRQEMEWGWHPHTGSLT
jgi:transcriptional regulator GlxA family with amidase domain